MVDRFADSQAVMQRAIELARCGLGRVEPNPLVGAVVVDDRRNLLGEGFHERFGGPHAEVHALRQAGRAAAGATMFVTLEPCCHQGKTPPCTEAIIRAGIRKVVVAMRDPAQHVDVGRFSKPSRRIENSRSICCGGGVAQLRSAGIDVEIGLLEAAAARLTAPFIKLLTTGVPYVHAKWAMTLDGKIASRTGGSQWISNRASRQLVHRMRGRMDAVIVGSQTALADDPLLTARPAGPRVAVRIVVDSGAKLPLDSQLARTADQFPVLVASSETAAADRVSRLEAAGVEVLRLPPADEQRQVDVSRPPRPDVAQLLKELGRRQMTNVLVEGGGLLLGSFFDRQLIDEVHVFIAPKIVGGLAAVTPLAGTGLSAIPELPALDAPEIELLDGDVYVHGRIRHDK